MRTAAPALLLGAAACAGDDVAYRPTPQILPQHISRIAIRPVINKTQQFGLEDKLTLRIRDEFLRDGRYPLVPESNADGLVLVTLKRYILTPTQYDSVLTPTAYKLIVLANLDFVDRTTNTILWSEPNLEGIQSFTASTLKGGITEEQARE
ncbi:MAG: LPS assembly lipoprotein LptE, partial [Elusimicrobiota bacterium]